jgi:tetratricopeptide (TPR) repeat protein
MKKILPCLLILLTSCASDPFAQAVNAWESSDYSQAQKLLEKVEEGHPHYDSAQFLLDILPDTAIAYWLGEAEIDLANQMFDTALENCQKALSFRFEDPSAMKLKDEIEKSAAQYWTDQAQNKFEAGNAEDALEDLEKAFLYKPKFFAASRLQEKIERSVERDQAKELRQAREEYAVELEKKLLDKGLNVTVSTKGTRSITLKIEYVDATKVDAHEIATDKKTRKELTELGFEKLIITNDDGERWEWDLTEE